MHELIQVVAYKMQVKINIDKFSHVERQIGQIQKSRNRSLSEHQEFDSLQIVLLLDMVPDQSMLDEGLAREVINRVQKARKKVSHRDINLQILHDMATPN